MCHNNNKPNQKIFIISTDLVITHNSNNHSHNHNSIIMDLAAAAKAAQLQMQTPESTPTTGPTPKSKMKTLPPSSRAAESRSTHSPLKNGSDVFYHRFGNGIPGHTTRAPQ